MTKIVLKTLLVILIGLIIVHFFVVVSDGVTRSDIWGLAIPTPPEWTTYVPYVGWIIGQVYEQFSLHGIVSIAIISSLGMCISMINRKPTS